MAEEKKEEKIPHYVCTGGCGLEAEDLKKCNSPGCIRNRNPLTECFCTDEKHGDLPEINVPKHLKGKVPWKRP